MNFSRGHYSFEVQAKIGKEKWGDEVQRVTFIITDPYWNTWWFHSLGFLSLIIVIYGFFKIRVLTYNKHIFKELLRIILKKIRGKKHYIIIKESGTEIKLNTENILFLKSSGNYVEVHTIKRAFLVRDTINSFKNLLPDKSEYIRIHRSYLIRIEKVQQKNTNAIQINGHKIPVGKTYKENLDRIIF